MTNSFDHLCKKLTDAEVQAGANPGESWEAARNRLSASKSALTAKEWTRFVHTIDDIQRLCLSQLQLSAGEDAGVLRTQVLHLHEFCCAIAEGREVLVIPAVRLRHTAFDEVYAQLSRLSSSEADWTQEIFIGLLDVLAHPDPLENLASLKSEGILRMVLNG
ncbi:hypothetical protein [Pseudomonas syringae group genomosp. 3]|uniref:hypothetical protein n=1 Tax=Pseudomonas syringae group genomosp. 3 TaxID=251701 RepID=UPI001068CB22|nr:hypothetical protein [Pseudomonas syringae group genomosp. 3]TES71948.1 hypothetical protein E2N89_30385 [Pseudomonas syringae pv. tomato]